MRRFLPALFLCAACGAGLVDHSGVDLSTLSCPMLRENCGGVCVATDSNPDNCGGCGNVCSTPALASRTCAARACGFTCNPGLFLCASGAACCPASALAAGGDTTCALVDTKVQCWGSNDAGQLGTSPTGATWSATPVVVPGLPAANSVAVGGHHACAILAGTGEVWCWGANSAGQLGDNTTTPHGAQKVTGISGATSLALGGVHSCALTPGGLVCWGANNAGQLGDGTTTERHLPSTPVVLPAAASSVSAGIAFTCAVALGSVYCWGSNDSGQLVDTTYIYSKDPLHVQGLSNVTSIGLGAAHGCAIGSGFWCWGEDSFGQVGDGKMQASSSISGVNGVSSPTAVAGGLAHTCAIDSGFNAFCWGSNSSGQLGTGGPGLGPQLRPVHLLGLSSVQRLALGATHSCAQTADGIVYCWGNNGNGQAGAPTGTADALTVLAPRPVGPVSH
jgi:alpha-tubulin suppressor-like RCC1 family protein